MNKMTATFSTIKVRDASFMRRFCFDSFRYFYVFMAILQKIIFLFPIFYVLLRVPLLAVSSQKYYTQLVIVLHFMAPPEMAEGNIVLTLSQYAWVCVYMSQNPTRPVPLSCLVGLLNCLAQKIIRTEDDMSLARTV